MNKLMEQLRLEDIEDELQRELVETVGMENYKKIVASFGGILLYIPKADSVTRAARDRQLKSEFNGYNHSDLARKYNLSETQVRNICGVGWLNGQTSIFKNTV